MKEEIKNYFRTDRSHAGGVSLIMKHSNKLGLKRQLNVQPESRYLTGVVHEELRTLAGITADEYNILMSAPVQKAKRVVQEPVAEPESTTQVLAGDDENQFLNEPVFADEDKAMPAKPKEAKKSGTNPAGAKKARRKK